jgi:hypothetical protein
MFRRGGTVKKVPGEGRAHHRQGCDMEFLGIAQDENGFVPMSLKFNGEDDEFIDDLDEDEEDDDLDLDDDDDDEDDDDDDLDFDDDDDDLDEDEDAE